MVLKCAQESVHGEPGSSSQWTEKVQSTCDLGSPVYAYAA